MDLRKQRTLKLLEDAFTQLINEKPFESITVAQLCDRAMIRRATFYRHFASKEDYLAHYVRARRSEADRSVLPSYQEGNLNSYCKAMTTELIEIAYDNDSLFRGLKLSANRDAFIAASAQALASDFEKVLLKHGGFAGIGAVNETQASAAFALFYISGLLSSLLQLLSNGATQQEAQAALFAIIDRINFPTSK